MKYEKNHERISEFFLVSGDWNILRMFTFTQKENPQAGISVEWMVIFGYIHLHVYYEKIQKKGKRTYSKAKNCYVFLIKFYGQKLIFKGLRQF